MLLKQARTSTLLRIGLVGLALPAALRLLLVRTGHSSDAIDFGLGMLVGISVALLLLVAWHRGLRRHGGSESA